MKKLKQGPFCPDLLSPKLYRIMKLTMLLLTLACMQVTANTYSQERITLKMKTADIKKSSLPSSEEANTASYLMKTL
ncbi:hypothetical protein [Paraflavitalea speifideaquila]|uniref:hypothetical protein n=1 Tax=Paraflavitalea speifideaquila TaxID=3076558 RepID=UPI0028E48280|nr:hypothetical protein [Paraflavitalea speifideiaquila]